MMTAADILKGITHTATDVVSAIEARGITNDSRAVKPGDLFIAIKGHQVDGTAFIRDAVAKGAVAVVAEKGAAVEGVPAITVANVREALPVIAGNFYHHPSRLLKMAGVTGTNGKTTITYILESIIRSAGKEPGVIGTINYRYGGTVVPSKNTTPGPVELQSILCDMVRAGVDYAVMEVSSHALDQRRVDNVWFDAAIVTNITADHLDYHETMARYIAAKAKVFTHLKEAGTAILNVDDIRAAALLEDVGSRTVLTYGIKHTASVRAKDMRLSLAGSTFIVTTPQASFDVRTDLVGMHNVSNILAAVAAALALKININAIRRGIERAAAVPGRLEPVEAGQPYKVFVDYAHTEDALYNILTLLRQVREKRIITVFGCGGNRDTTKRPKMGKVVCELSDEAIITSDNPRFEEPGAIIRDIEHGVKGAFTNYRIVEDRRAAIETALGMAGPGDIVVIAGKGHEDYQIVKDAVLHFDDREVVREILRQGVPA